MTFHPPRLLGDILAFFVSLLLAFFGLFNVLFSDIFGLKERIGSWVYVFVLYVVFGFLFALIWPEGVKRWRWWFGLPAGAVAIRVILTEPGTALVDLTAFVAAFGGILLGTMAGGRVRSRPPSAPV